MSKAQVKRNDEFTTETSGYIGKSSRSFLCPWWTRKKNKEEQQTDSLILREEWYKNFGSCMPIGGAPRLPAAYLPTISLGNVAFTGLLFIVVRKKKID